VKYIEDVRPGECLPSLELAATLTALMTYAGATWDFHRYHYDADFVTKHGMPAPFMDGQMVGALMARLLMQWGGPDAFVRRLIYRQRTMIYVKEKIAVTGRVTGLSEEAGRPVVNCGISVVKSDGVYVVRDATATVELTHRPGHRP
jgi:acyl dehydratase